MRAAVYHGRHDVRVTEVEQPTVGPTDVAIDVAHCGICGSDVHEYDAGPIAIPEDDPHPLTGETLPLTMGHEFSGTVATVGSDVEGVEAGDRVTVNPAIWCGDCRYCDRGDYHICAAGGSIGLAGWTGGLADRAVVPATQVVPVPDEVPLDHAALAEPYAVALHALRQSSVQAGDDVAVFGGGPIGLGIAQLSQVAGASRVFVSEPQDGRREKAAQVGAEALDPREVSVVHEVASETDGGVATSFEAAGVEAALEAAIRTPLKGGEVVLVSVFEEPATVRTNYLMMAERTLTGTLAYQTGPRAADFEFAAVLELMADGRLDPAPLVTDRIDLSSVVESGFEALVTPEEQVKILVSP